MEGEFVTFTCADGVVLGGHWWPVKSAGDDGSAGATIIVNAATGVHSRFYHHYARFLASHGYDVLTWDYRGVGLSRPDDLRGTRFRWRDWGQKDFEAALGFAQKKRPGQKIKVVGHSIGGFLPGYAAAATGIDRMLTVGAQYAYWPDYRTGRRASLFLRWHVAMPFYTLLNGYFPGRKLGWLEDLPAGVAHEWSFRGERIEARLPRAEQERIVETFSSVKAPILAVSVTDDDFCTPSAMRRALSYYGSSERIKVMLKPADLGLEEIGHFDLFRAKHAPGFWLDTLLWLRDGINPWPQRRFD